MTKKETLDIINSILSANEKQWSDMVEKNSEFFEQYYPNEYSDYKESMDQCFDNEEDSFLTHPAVDLCNDIKFALMDDEEEIESYYDNEDS